jgi:hypothetical protein
MTAQELIKKYKLFLAAGDNIGVPNVKRVPAYILDEMRAKKPEIVAELKARKAAAEAEAAAKKAEFEAEIAAIRCGEKKVTAEWRSGSILSGFTVYDEAAEKALEAAKIGRYVSGWGWLIPEQVITALGTEFALPDAKALVETRTQKKPSLEQLRREKCAEAQRTGKPAEIRRWTEACSDPKEECSTDLVVEYALPDGSVKVKRSHTW